MIQRWPAEPLTVTDEYLAAILEELRSIRAQLVQEPQASDPDRPRLVTEPAPTPARGGPSEVHQ